MIPTSTKSGNAIAVFPDVCKTPSPGGPVPIPYPNLATTGQAKTAVKTATLGLTPSAQKVSTGDVAGTSMQGIAGQAKTAAISYTRGTPKVSLEGTSVQLMGDLRIHNQGVAGRASVQDLRNQLQRLHAQIMVQPAGSAGRCSGPRSPSATARAARSIARSSPSWLATPTPAACARGGARRAGAASRSGATRGDGRPATRPRCRGRSTRAPGCGPP